MNRLEPKNNAWFVISDLELVGNHPNFEVLRYKIFELILGTGNRTDYNQNDFYNNFHGNVICMLGLEENCKKIFQLKISHMK